LSAQEDRLDAHRAPAAGQSQRHDSEPGMGSVLGSFTPVRSRSPVAAQHESAHAMNGSGRW
jgi:hypothetical protein